MAEYAVITFKEEQGAPPSTALATSLQVRLTDGGGRLELLWRDQLPNSPQYSIPLAGVESVTFVDDKDSDQ
jgi:hypothetical protein